MKLVVESKLDQASFTGWRTGNVHTLENGQSWRVTGTRCGWETCNLHWPVARIWQDGSTYYMEVEGLWDIKQIEVELDSEAEPVEEPEEEQDSSGDAVLQAVEDLVAIYQQHPQGFVRGDGDPAGQEVRRIGSMLNAQGGMDLMRSAHETFAYSCGVRGAARNLEIMWDGIGDWMG